MLCFISATLSASISTESLTASINEVQKRFAAVPKDKRIVDSSSSGTSSDSSSSGSISYDQKSDASESEMPESERPAPSVSSDTEKAAPKAREKHRNDKMLDFYRYYAAQAAQGATVAPQPSYSFPYYPYYNPYYQQPYVSAYYSPYYSPIVDPSQTAEEYDDAEYPETESNDVDGGETDEDGSRANKRRPGGGKNSPIFYIRLPPTPYSKYHVSFVKFYSNRSVDDKLYCNVNFFVCAQCLCQEWVTFHSRQQFSRWHRSIQSIHLSICP